MPTTPHISRAFQWDLARQVERLDFLLEWLPRYAEWGYQELYLHLEDAVEYPSLPGVARPDAYSYQQFIRLVEAATAAGIRVVPIVNLLGHTQYLIKTPGLRDLNELRDAEGGPLARGQICPLHPRTLEIADKLLCDMTPFCTAGKVHVGLDESFHLGKCPRCRADIERRGLAAHFAGHVNQLERLTTGRGLRLGLWADMLALLPAAIPLLPRGVIAYDWYYYPFARHPRIELRNFAEVDLAAPLQAHGIEYWGCPMNGAFRYEPLPVFGERLANILSWWKRCCRVGAGGFLVTSWEANRLAIELTMAVDAAAACLWLDPEIEEPQEMLARGFARMFGRSSANPYRLSQFPGLRGILEGEAPAEPKHKSIGAARQEPRPPGHARGPMELCVNETRRWARAALAGDEYAFAGYHRWQINDRWDVCAGRDGIAPYAKELRALGRICRSLEWHGRPARGLNITGGTPVPQDRLREGSNEIPPPALTASLAFRLYLAQRDVFVRSAAEAVFQLRRLSSAGLGPASRPSRRSETGATFASLLAEASAFATALRAGRVAARAMWCRSRDPRVRGPNELMLERDAERLREWTRWLRDAARNPDLIWQATPVCGAWQLLFTVHNLAPAMQMVVVEQQQPDGTWATLYGLHTIEFRAFAAHSRTTLRREFSVPIADLNHDQICRAASPGSALPAKKKDCAADGAILPLRLAMRGVGQIAVSHVELTNGVVRCHPTGWPSAHKKLLGRPAPLRDFPEMDWTKNQESRGLTFRLRAGRVSRT